MLVKSFEVYYNNKITNYYFRGRNVEGRDDTYPKKTNFYRFPWSKNDNPIGWLEITDICNIHCKGCYRQKITGHKSLDEIKEEISLFKEWRNCDNISISGGEPLLHPDITEIVAWVWKHKMKPILLTNAVLLTRDKLRELKDAGLKGLTMHIDSFQKRPQWKGKNEKELNELRMYYADMAHEIGGLFCSFNSTVYAENFKYIPAIVAWANKHISKVHSIIFITYRGVPESDDFEYIAGDKKVEVKDVITYTSKPDEQIDITSVNVYNILKQNIPHYDASGYLGGTYSIDAYKWFVGSLIATKKEILGCFGKKGLEISQVLHHLKYGTYPAYLFSNRVGRKAFLLSFFDPKVRKALGRYMKNPLNIFRSVYAQGIGIIQAPDVTREGADMCDSCPDLTWYQGNLVNSCRLDELRKYGDFIRIAQKDS